MRTEQQFNQEGSLIKNIPALINKQRPTFAELSYAELAKNLNNYYRQIVTYMAMPGIIQYSDLVQLRQRAISPDLQNPAFNRCRAQLHLAADLLRLGRRHEGLTMLKDLETRLLEWQRPSQSLCYLLWIGLLRAAARDRQGAFYLAVQLVSHKTDRDSDMLVAEFFQNLHMPNANLI